MTAAALRLARVGAHPASLRLPSTPVLELFEPAWFDEDLLVTDARSRPFWAGMTAPVYPGKWTWTGLPSLRKRQPANLASLSLGC